MTVNYNNLFGKRKRGVLSIEQQNELMLKISRSDSYDEIREMFNKLYDSLSPQIWSLLFNKYIPPLSVDDLKDVFQESWIKILESRDRYDAKYNVFNWVYVIKKNMVIDKIRKITRNRDLFIEEPDDNDEGIGNSFFPELKSDETPVDDNIILSETIDIIRNSVNSIADATEREIMIRRLFHDEKLEIIAEEMNIPLSTVYNYIKKSLKRLKPQITTIINS